MSIFVFSHTRNFVRDVRAKNFGYIFHIPIPAYLLAWQQALNLLLTVFLVTMLACEPILHCMSERDGNFAGSGLFTHNCPHVKDLKLAYSIFSSGATVLYFLLLVDLSVFSTSISAFVLVCGRVVSEVGLFLVALLFFIVAFGCSTSALKQDNVDFDAPHRGMLSLLSITLGMYEGTKFEALHQDSALLTAIIAYVISTITFMLNLLVAQLNCSYSSCYEDMLGFARLNLGKIVVSSMAAVSHKRWTQFVESLQLDQRLEFNEGDVGLSGGIQVLEPASLHVTTVDSFRRFGGSTSPAMQWPEEDQAGNEDEDRFERMEKVIERAMKKLGSSGKSHGTKTYSMTGSSKEQSSSNQEKSVSSEEKESEAGSH